MISGLILAGNQTLVWKWKLPKSINLNQVYRGLAWPMPHVVLQERTTPYNVTQCHNLTYPYTTELCQQSHHATIPSESPVFGFKGQDSGKPGSQSVVGSLVLTHLSFVILAMLFWFRSQPSSLPKWDTILIIISIETQKYLTLQQWLLTSLIKLISTLESETTGIPQINTTVSHYIK